MLRKIAAMNGLDVLYTSIQGRYAKALFECGNKSNKLPQILTDFDKLNDLLHRNKNIQKIIFGTGYNKTQLNELLQQIGNHLSLCDIFVNFVRILAENNRLNLLSKIQYVYQKAYNEQKNIRNVTVCSVIELNESQKLEIKNLAENFFGQDIVMYYKIDKMILGGIKILTDDIVVDATLATQIRQLANHLKKARIEVKHEN